MFLNLSNHPSQDWSSIQRTEAEALGGEVVDEAFPEVSPGASADEVANLGATMISAIVPRHPAAVMVQGEFTLAFYLVHQLQSRGIPCYAATTRRTSESVPQQDGATVKTSRFQFVQFRRYIEGAAPDSG